MLSAAAAVGDHQRWHKNKKTTTVCWFPWTLARFLPQAWHMNLVWAGASTNIACRWQAGLRWLVTAVGLENKD